MLSPIHVLVGLELVDLQFRDHVKIFNDAMYICILRLDAI